ncbi:MAG: hypothetical protein NXI15_04685 [Gammaproteobacteria bacterium]|jgi:hypothetical protein|nr:hypothetical protein [Gammaproteobacteria bacterium]
MTNESKPNSLELFVIKQAGKERISIDSERAASIDTEIKQAVQAINNDDLGNNWQP